MSAAGATAGRDADGPAVGGPVPSAAAVRGVAAAPGRRAGDEPVEPAGDAPSGRPRPVGRTGREAPVPTPRLAGLAAAALVLAPLAVRPAPWAGMAVAAAAVVTVAAVDWARGTRPSTIDVRHRLPAVLSLGAAGRMERWVGMAGHRPARIDLADGLAPSLGAPRRVEGLRVPPAGWVRHESVLRPGRRGRFAVGEVVVRVHGPLGLVARQAARRSEAEVRVYPAFASRNEAELALRRARLGDEGLRLTSARGGSTEFDSLREYTVDDEFRRIDWAATARLGKPIVRTYRVERNQTVLVLVDTGRVMAGRLDGTPRIEHALDGAMLLAALAGRLGDRAGLVAYDDRVRTVVRPSRTGGQLGRITEALHRLEPRLVESDHRAAFAETLTRFRRRAMVVVLTELDREPVAAGLEPALPLVAREHLVVVAGVRDPATDRWATAPVGGADDVHRRAAALDALADRQRLAARLGRLGARVVDEPPGRLGPALADAYVGSKVAGRL